MGALIKGPDSGFLETEAGAVPGAAAEERPGVFMRAGQGSARWILRHLLTAREPQGPTNMGQALLKWDSLGVGRGFRRAGVSC